MALHASHSSFSREISIIINWCVCERQIDTKKACVYVSAVMMIKLKGIWGKINDARWFGGLKTLRSREFLRKRDADKTDLQIVPSTRQCNLTWCDVCFFVFFPLLSGVPPRVCNVEDRMEKRQEQFAKCLCCTKSSSWQNVHLHFCSARNCLGDRRFLNIQNRQRWSDGWLITWYQVWVINYYQNEVGCFSFPTQLVFGTRYLFSILVSHCRWYPLK